MGTANLADCSSTCTGRHGDHLRIYAISECIAAFLWAPGPDAIGIVPLQAVLAIDGRYCHALYYYYSNIYYYYFYWHHGFIAIAPQSPFSMH